MLGGQRLFDNFYWIGNTGIGAWLVTSNGGYILFDTMNSEDDARDIIIPAMKKLNLDLPDGGPHTGLDRDGRARTRAASIRSCS